jgi:hypothetical protein
LLADRKEVLMSFDQPNPYAPASSTPPVAPKKSNTLLYVLLGVGGILLVSCLGCAGLLYVVGSKGMGMVAAQVKPQLQADPVVQEHIGTISEATLSIQDATVELQKNAERHKGRNFGFKLKGDKGSGLVMGRLDQSNPQNARIVDAELVLPDGTFHKLKE